MGKRRSLQQLSEYTNVDFKSFKGNVGATMQCVGAKWVPYDDSISPVDNLFDNPDNLDPQPEYPLRTQLTYYQQVEEALPDLDVDIGGGAVVPEPRPHADAFPVHESHKELPPFALLFVLWVFGLIVWCVLFLSPGSSVTAKSHKKRSEGFKDV